MRRITWLVVAFAVVVAGAGYGLVHVFDGSAQPAQASTSPAQAGHSAAPDVPAASGSAKAGSTTTTVALTVTGLKRKYTVIKPTAALARSAPVIVALAGFGSTVPQEISRDQLAPYAAAGQAEVVYPWGLGDSWNAVGCCGYASEHNVNDIAFLKAVIAKVDPGRTRPAYVVGYSNGARLAYRVVCTDPALFNGYAMVKGVPTPGCTVKPGVNLIQVASVDDPEIPYQPGDKGLEPLPVTTLMSQVRQAEQCPAKSAVSHAGTMKLTTWSGCGKGTRLAFAVWAGGKHSFPRPPASVPAASAVIWSFFTKTKLAAVPGAS
jgi:polyhydroxybutyrate depolymerase